MNRAYYRTRGNSTLGSVRDRENDASYCHSQRSFLLQATLQVLVALNMHKHLLIILLFVIMVKFNNLIVSEVG